MSHVSLGGGKGCWLQTFGLTKRLMVELVKYCGYLNRENIVFNRSHSSERYAQEEENRFARSSIFVNKPRL